MGFEDGIYALTVPRRFGAEHPLSQGACVLHPAGLTCKKSACPKGGSYSRKTSHGFEEL